MSLNQIELNAILYYADILSLQYTDTPVTDNCKYFFVYGTPINASYLSNTEPFYEVDNKYLKQAYEEYNQIKDQYGDQGVLSFIESICNISVCGSVDAIRMLKCIHQYDEACERKAAVNHYNKWKKGLQYKLTTINEDGEPEEIECSEYIARLEQSKHLGTVRLDKQNNKDSHKS